MAIMHRLSGKKTMLNSFPPLAAPPLSSPSTNISLPSLPLSPSVSKLVRTSLFYLDFFKAVVLELACKSYKQNSKEFERGSSFLTRLYKGGERENGKRGLHRGGVGSFVCKFGKVNNKRAFPLGVNGQTRTRGQTLTVGPRGRCAVVLCSRTLHCCTAGSVQLSSHQLQVAIEDLRCS